MASKPIVVGELVTTAWLNSLWICVYDAVLGASAGSIDTGAVLPTSYADMLIKVQARGDTAAATANLVLRLNNDAGSNYDYQIQSDSAATFAASETFGASGGMIVGVIPANTAAAGLAGQTTIGIFNYGNATFNKVATSLSDNKIGTATGNMSSYRIGGHWRSAAAVNRVAVLPAAGNLVTGSRMTVWVAGGA
jgi:hypothetical protein